ncbi:glutamate-ammonia-ligase adenylyltransferase [Labedella gwakjiensis]|uniref:Bifunctional [glutamine synthetase] adenylyltransferase/[glutamine synthetase]-adenylyl-L-tyrosine phosphorylase n=1 Tax=Labedella gwakjiensis TaxID=390269 RepID=A0A2P8GZM8_9MICO|nr:bifunctional [glutamine synthetase] adenylyltransferase/[glutamine synthetase]-adenylyl-L-tyrosine phosphorylase [Labedella gwakjiensis]PSL39408.1 glutamate-ammonia-ligase adenylyltransferase [Labedella gwakjiensis]RUQ86185.1 bifunctional [glutamine synthetase] adenylyltransferase/[glutamine synthetase]-adenylyl-L-tyrosine phosphorylase [Labedella gwakjiensis]
MRRELATLSGLARVGFTALSDARAALDELDSLSIVGDVEIVGDFAEVADPDAALGGLLALARSHPDEVRRVCRGVEGRRTLLQVLGASRGLADFLHRHPECLDAIEQPVRRLPEAIELRTSLLESVGAVDGVSRDGTEDEWGALRTRYRRLLTMIAAFDLTSRSPVSVVARVSECLADLAGAALDASLAVARRMVSSETPRPGVFPAGEVRSTRLAIIGMGKAGASELNYVSDVDVIFVGEPDGDRISSARAIDISTRLAVLTMRGIAEPAIEPPLWEVDANLRPEGKAGALVRTLDSHLAYYDRWAKSWEFQALLKARSLAGDRDLGDAYVAAVSPRVWNSSSRDGFVESVQKMRERVTAHIPSEDVHHQLKLGPGGLRDIEFTVQLLQLVHGSNDEGVRQRGTLAALEALASHGYIGRTEAADFAEDYRVLRVLEHRLQLTRLRRTHLMPRDDDALRALARGSRLASTAGELIVLWERTKHSVRSLHERLFYRPLLTAVAALPDDEFVLTPAQAGARLAAIGFHDPAGAFAHIAALTSGVSRKATIQRLLLPVLLRWFAEGADPDYGLLTFRRVSESLGDSHWFLRMLRDSSGAAERLTRVLSGSRYIGELMDRFPEAAAWLGDDGELRAKPRAVLDEEMHAILSRHEDLTKAAASIRRVRRREILRLAMSSVLGINSLRDISDALTDVTTATLSGMLGALRDAAVDDPPFEFAIIGMGRYGGRELGFGSDTDVIYVFRPTGERADEVPRAATRLVHELARLTDDSRLPLDLDIGLRPEGKNGPVTRSLDSYRAYYERWSLTWEAQALLRARPVVGDAALLDDFGALADSVRYRKDVSDADVREVKRIKARVESERLPQGADPARHVKLGRGSLSDVEWLVQLIQLEHAAEIPALRTTSTREALAVARDEGLVEPEDAELLDAAWVFSSRVRSAMTLWLNRTTDVLPSDRRGLDGIARILEYPPGSASDLEEDYLAVTRRSRAVFERLFYGIPDTD